LNNAKFDITIDARMINHSGIGTYIKNLIPNLVDKYNLALLGNSNILKLFPWSNQVKIFNADYPIYSLSEQINLPGDIPDSRLFISPHYNIPLRNISSDKRLVIIHDVNHLVKINKISFIKESYAKYMINAAIKKSDRVITDSYFSQKEIIKYISKNGKKIKVIHCGINGEEIKSLANQINHEEFRQKYNLPQSYFLYVGSIKAHKNLISALKAFKILIKKYPTQKLVLIGVKQDEFFNHPAINDLRDDVIVPGYISDYELPAVYANALCLVFPSLYEGFGLPPLEAMSCGCPVIASNLSSIPEVCGDAALYFNPLNIEEIFKTMQKIIEDLNIVVQLRENGFENLKRFTWQIFSSNIKQEIDNLIIK
jgi:glycosyltransferase involved in cell wall biosynthesis